MIKCKQTIAILLATYNGEQFLREQIDSIINQTFSDWHLFIHDDASIDHTLAIAKEYQDRYSDKITILEYPSQGGACNNFFSLLESVEANYYMFCDQDDVWCSNKILYCFERIIGLEVSNPGMPIIVHSDLTLVDGNLCVIAPSFIENQNIKIEKVRQFIDYSYTNIVTGCTMLFNAETVKCIKYPRIKARMHDSWVTLSVVAQNGIVCFIDKPLVFYRQHSNNTIGAKEIEKITLWTKLKHFRSIFSEIMDHYWEMNDIRPIGLVEYFRARYKYKNS